LAWGVGFIPQSAWTQLEKDYNLVEAIWINIVAYVKPFKVAWVLEIGHWNPLSVIEQKKWVQYQSIIIQKSFMDGMFVYLNFFLLTLFAYFNWNLIFLKHFFVLGF
jgi:hypothetical protein